MASAAASRLLQRSGTVVKAGTMAKTVKVQSYKQQWNKLIRKYFTVPYTYLVHDPNNSLIEGDVITAVSEHHTSNVNFTVKSILAPFGKPIEERPPLLSYEEREALHEAKMAPKRERREERIRQGIRPVPGKGKKWPRDVKEALVDDGGAGGGKGPGGRGRTVLPGGRHKFGDINDESLEAQRKIAARQRQANENVKDRSSVEDTRREEYQKEALDAKEALEK